MAVNIDLEDHLHFAAMQLLIGLGWWSASSIALYFALGSGGDSVLWYGGCLAALFNWFRFGVALFASKVVFFSFFKGARLALFAIVLAVVGFSATYIGSEALRTMDPTVGTCWAVVESNDYSPVACWSGASELKTIAFGETESGCPKETDYVFVPTAIESRYHCLITV
jgi:hypothetical protein